MTPSLATRSRFFHAPRILAIGAIISAGCGAHGDADPRPLAAAPTPAPVQAAPAVRAAPAPIEPEAQLGVTDRGIWSELDAKVQLALPAGVAPARVTAQLDEARHLLIVAIDGAPRKAYPLGGDATLTIGERALALRPGDRAELAPLLAADRVTAGSAARDRDGDGLPDALDLLIGAKKTVLNADAYTEEAQGYISLRYPMGDVPRAIGVCTDVVIRAARNAGVDLQQALHEDIQRARAAYPMVKGRGDPNIDQRRVGTLLPYFRRHWEAHTPRLDDPEDPLLPGDVIFMDTFPQRSGPDHIGILSDRVDAQGLPLVINNWTNGTVTAEMDLLVFVPVLFRFRLPH